MRSNFQIAIKLICFNLFIILFYQLSYAEEVYSVLDSIVSVKGYTYLEKTRFENDEYLLKVVNIFSLPDTIKEDSSNYFLGNVLVNKNKKKQNSDTVDLAFIDDYRHETLINYHSNKLKLSYPLFEVKNRGWSDYTTHKFYTLNADTLCELFTLNWLVDSTLSRLDDSTLKAKVTERDELVQEFWDVNVKISLKDWNVDEDEIVIDNFNYKTIALEDIYGYEIKNLQKKPFKIKKGTKLKLMKFDREKNLITLKVGKKTIYIEYSEDFGYKFQGNGAG